MTLALEEEISLDAFKTLVEKAFVEDCALDDRATRACIPENMTAQGRIMMKQDGCVAGLKFLHLVFQWFDSSLTTRLLAEDGGVYEDGTVLAEITGPARSLLSAERVALNFLQQLSGVAHLTSLCRQKIKGTSCEILSTKKTILGQRDLQQYAVRMGGGQIEPKNLENHMLIKANHFALNSDDRAAALFQCVMEAKKLYPEIKIQVEIPSFELMSAALRSGADAILLDSLPLDEIRKCVELNQQKVYLEAIGKIQLETVRDYALTGINGISIGALTHSAPVLDMCMRVKKI